MRHDVERLWRKGTYIFKLKCTCGDVITGASEADCGHWHDLHILDAYRDRDAVFPFW